MNLTLREKDKLLVSVAAMVAERRLRCGVKLNYPEHPAPGSPCRNMTGSPSAGPYSSQ